MSQLQIRRIEDWLKNTPYVSVIRPRLPNKYKLWYNPNTEDFHINIDNKEWRSILQGNLPDIVQTLQEALLIYSDALDNHIEDEDIHRETFVIVGTLTSGGWSDGVQTIFVNGISSDSEVFEFNGGDRSNKNLFDDHDIMIDSVGSGSVVFSHEPGNVPMADIVVKLLIYV
jgi:hypothetical protein